MKKGIYELNKEKVINWYSNKKSGVWIQKKLRTKNKKIYDYLRKWGIEVRTISEALDVHHIDFDKNNNEEYNLITLCKQCHNKTILKYYILYWIRYYQQKMEVIKIGC